MHNHEPLQYVCPICNLCKGIESEYNKTDDIVYQTDMTFGFVSPRWWPNNPGHVLVVPIKHFENIYDTPKKILQELISTTQEISIAIKETYKCDGISIRQHNEPAGNQDMWHFHLHVFPRWDNDNLYLNHSDSRFITPAERLPYAIKLRNYFAKHHIQGK